MFLLSDGLVHHATLLLWQFQVPRMPKYVVFSKAVLCSECACGFMYSPMQFDGLVMCREPTLMYGGLA